jgi:hypothetical protein
LFLIKFLFSFSFGVLAIFAIVATLVASGAIAPFDVVKKLTLEFRSDFLAVNDGFQVGSLEPFGEFSGLFAFGAAGEMGFILIVWFLGGLVFGRVSFFLDSILFRSFSFGGIEEAS